MTLPAFAAKHGAHRYRSISAETVNPPAAAAAVDGWDRQRDGHPTVT